MFARLDNAFFTYPYDQSRIGDTVYLKFQSFNVFGGGMQSLADCTAYRLHHHRSGAGFAAARRERTSTPTIEAGFQKIYWDQIDGLPQRHPLRVAGRATPGTRRNSSARRRIRRSSRRATARS